ncbi:MAG: hypothetical protein FWG81_11005 [Betaproteobacteria bacterium]|nr:hypothetical protein [Betaproteobacteria bacterium]
MSDDESLLEEVCDLDLIFREEYSHDVQVQARSLKKWNDQLVYPSLSDQVVPRFVTAGQARSRQLSPESRHSFFSSSILDDLHAQSDAILSEQERQQQEILRMKAQFDASFRRLFAFLDELTRQLNILKPAIPRVYQLTGEHEFKNLVWQEGRVDYRSDNLAATAELESVTLTYRLASEDPPLYLERESDFVDSLYRRLFDHGLQVDIEKRYDERRALKKARFTVQPEIKTQVRWLGNPEDGRLRCETNNLERFGRLTWLLPADAPMDMRFLDEFGRLILGQEHDFPYILNRTP